MEKVQILLSTYNGANYIRSLINSLLNQDYGNIDILIRDDGSRDGTIHILEEYAEYKNIKIYYEQNIGVVKSFFKLLTLTSSDTKYFAFCDQDDIWMRDKISHAVARLSGEAQQVPLMYCGRAILVDENLSVIGSLKIPPRGPFFGNALVENIAAGCTMVINAEARDLIINNIPSFALMHDMWIYLVISAFGKVIYDKEPKLFYRQHSNNTSGVKRGLLQLWQARLQRFRRNGNRLLCTRQAEEFNRIYGRFLNHETKDIIEPFLNNRHRSVFYRIKYALSNNLYCQSTINQIILKSLIVLNRV